MNQKKLPGKNLLGQILERERDSILEKERDEFYDADMPPPLEGDGISEDEGVKKDE